MEKRHDNGGPDRSGLGFEEVHGRGDFQFPQLEMHRDNLEDLPEIELPPGYSIRPFIKGDEEAWGAIMSEAFTGFWSADRFKRLMRPHYGFRPERVRMLIWRGRPVGSASAFDWPGIGRGMGYLHMVGVKKEHCGKALGYWLAASCLWVLREQGFRGAVLQTEDFRIPAIKHYLRLGFRPYLVRESQRATWRALLDSIGGGGEALETRLEDLPVMGSLRFWWRTTLVSNYMSWLNLKGDLMGIRRD